jgi:cytochrome oxidase Cu insertion factor (SCO1/SenC/PrrC family)
MHVPTVQHHSVRVGLTTVFMLVMGILATSLLGSCDRQCAVQGDDSALLGGAFEAVDHNNRPFSHKALEGRYQLVFFGFTSCPDVCPTELSVISTALDQLGNKAAYFQPVFVTIDPDRDTPDRMKAYLDNFHESFVGLTGTAEQIKDLAHVYRAYYARSREPVGDGYNMDHSSITYLMDCEGRYIRHFTHGTGPDEMAAVLAGMI